MKNKPFDQSLYDEYNQKGIEAAKQFYKSLFNLDSIDVVEDYGIDLKLFNNYKIYVRASEVEVRAQWNKDQKNFPYPIVHIPARKYKYIEKIRPILKDLSNIDFLIFNKACTIAYLSNFDYILGSPLKEIPNIYMPKDEYFYTVPKECFTYYDLIDDCWQIRE